MVTVKSRAGESGEDLLRRFKKAVENSGVLSDFRKREYYEKPSVKRKKKSAAAKKRILRQEQRTGGRKSSKPSKAPAWKWNKNHTKKIVIKPYAGPRKQFNGPKRQFNNSPRQFNGPRKTYSGKRNG